MKKVIKSFSIDIELAEWLDSLENASELVNDLLWEAYRGRINLLYNKYIELQEQLSKLEDQLEAEIQEILKHKEELKLKELERIQQIKKQLEEKREKEIARVKEILQRIPEEDINKFFELDNASKLDYIAELREKYGFRISLTDFELIKKYKEVVEGVG